MNHLKKIVLCLLTACLFLSAVLCDASAAQAKSIYSRISIYGSCQSTTVYTDQRSSLIGVIKSYASTSNSDKERMQKALDKVDADLVWTTSNPDVVQFLSGYTTDENGQPVTVTVKKLTRKNNYLRTALSSAQLIGLSEGTSTVTVKSKLLNQTLKYKVTVKKAELAADNGVFYAGNSYTFSMRGDATAESFASSDPSIASIDAATGKLKAKKTGKVTISCVADDGNTYKCRLKIRKKGLSYTKLTSYYYTGMSKGHYTTFPLVAAGIDVKSWKSSNPKVCTVVNLGSVGNLQMRSTGKCTITCTDTKGKKYTCKLTVTGGKTWGGLNNGYRPTLSTLKTHGYYKDINKVMDYGNVIVTIIEYDHDISLGNGNKPLTHQDCENTRQILRERFPYQTVEYAVGGDYLLFTNNSGTENGRLWLSCYYVNN